MKIEDIEKILDSHLDPIKQELDECKLILTSINKELDECDKHLVNINSSLDSIENTFTEMDKIYDSHNRHCSETEERLNNMVLVSGKGHQPGCDPDT